MDVYYSENGNPWRGKHNMKLTRFSICRTFLWENQEFFIPAVYVGKAGAVLDVCAKIPSEDMIEFLQKWNREKRLSLRSQEEFEQMDNDNPASREFKVKMRLNAIPLTLRMASSLRWYPEDIFLVENEESWPNDQDAEKLMEAYGCDRSCCWHFGRLVYQWNGDPILFPKEISLHLQANILPVTTEHFTTNLSCNGQELKTIHPKTGQEYILTLHGCEQSQTSFAKIAQKDMCYPEYYQTLSYSVWPESGRNFIHILDQVQSDQPRKDTAPVCIPGGKSGSTAVFMAGKNAIHHRQMACSSLHFSPVWEVQWRVVFDIKPRNDIEIHFSVNPCDVETATTPT